MAKSNTPSQQLSRDELAEWYTELAKSAKKEIVSVAGEFLTLKSSKLVDTLIEKLKQGISVTIYIYDPKPERKKIDKLLSYGAKVFLTQNYSKYHYFVVDNKSLSYHSHKRYDDVLLKDKDAIEKHLIEFNQTLNEAKRNALKLSHSKLNLILAIVITITLFGTAIIALPFPLNILVGIACLGPFFLEMATLKEVYHA